MNIALWIVQILLALVFLMAGFMKATQSKESLIEKSDHMAWVEDFSSGTIKYIGVLEILGAIGLIIPAVTGIFPMLTPLAAAGLALTMVGAAVVHIRRKEYSGLVGNLVLFLMAAFVAYGRFALVPLT